MPLCIRRSSDEHVSQYWDVSQYWAIYIGTLAQLTSDGIQPHRFPRRLSSQTALGTASRDSPKKEPRSTSPQSGAAVRSPSVRHRAKKKYPKSIALKRWKNARKEKRLGLCLSVCRFFGIHFTQVIKSYRKKCLLYLHFLKKKHLNKNLNNC